MIKYASNAYHALKVVFANEMGRVCNAQGINASNVMKVFAQDTKLNISAKYLMPGFAFGGSCLPKDLRAITSMARTSDVDLPVINAILSSNESLIQLTVKRILAYKKRAIGMIGLSFKANTDDLRESPALAIVETLASSGAGHLLVVEPNIEALPIELAGYPDIVLTDIADALSRADIVVFLVNHRGFAAIKPAQLQGKMVVNACGWRQ